MKLVEILEETMLRQKRGQNITLNKLLGDDNDNNNRIRRVKHKKSRIWMGSFVGIGGIGGSSHNKLPTELMNVNYELITMLMIESKLIG